jgi:hypothetical protein
MIPPGPQAPPSTVVDVGQARCVCRSLPIPANTLTLRIVLSFAVSQLDYVHDACPPHLAGLLPLQRLVDSILLAALRAPRSYPKALLYAPLRLGGLGGPHLAPRLELRFVRGALQALNSRNALSRRCCRALLSPQRLQEIPGNDLLVLQSLLAEHALEVSLPPHPSLTPAAEESELLRPYAGQPVLLVSDGSAPEGRLGWGAVVADHDGPLARCRGGALVDLATSWAAEWCGKLAAVRLADRVGVPPEQRRWAIADNISACLGSDGGRPSGTACIDLVRLAYARAASEST